LFVVVFFIGADVGSGLLATLFIGGEAYFLDEDLKHSLLTCDASFSCCRNFALFAWILASASGSCFGASACLNGDLRGATDGDFVGAALFTADPLTGAPFVGGALGFPFVGGALGFPFVGTFGFPFEGGAIWFPFTGVRKTGTCPDFTGATFPLTGTA
jgi:hypothetical protein